MSSMQVAGRELALGPKGFLASFDAWNHDVAEAMAAEQGLVLTRRHWAVIEFLRDYYSEFGHPPSPRLKQACRIAGLPEYYCHSC